MSSKIFSLVDLVERPDQTMKEAREAGAVVPMELGPLVVRHAAVRALAQDPRLRPSFSRMLERIGITGGAFYDWMSRRRSTWRARSIAYGGR